MTFDHDQRSGVFSHAEGDRLSPAPSVGAGMGASGLSPPAKRFIPANDAGDQGRLVDALDDYARRFDIMAQVMSGLLTTPRTHTETLGEINTSDAVLKDKLRVMESQIATVAKDVVDNDAKFKDDLRTLEGQVTATAAATQNLMDSAAANTGKINQILEEMGKKSRMTAGQGDKDQRTDTMFKDLAKIQYYDGRARTGYERHTRDIEILRGEFTNSTESLATRVSAVEEWVNAASQKQGVGSSGAHPGGAVQPAPAAPDADQDFPMFDVDTRGNPGNKFSIPTHKKPSFEDKVAIAPRMQYSDEKKREWAKTTSNYFISNPFEMSANPGEESAQSTAIMDAHVGWCDVCS